MGGGSLLRQVIPSRPGDFQKGPAGPLLVVSIRMGPGRGRNRNLPLLSVVFFGTFLLDKQKKATPRPWGGILRVAQDDAGGDERGRHNGRPYSVVSSIIYEFGLDY